ncbi:restriction system modified-DNA reader domain-containing protein [Streptomyces kebangsaanensis]|uniref:restriction system modified-DNA reader domain-containing protein n=1 Tax=Streptomyces kebangsaanensis TaxID=864058 RepID=UPI0013015786|nr:DUF4357 domain-containing protein [Streptomyces kebangsaanensis]
MSRRTIVVDDEVFERLQREAQPLIDTPNSVLRRLLALDARPVRPGPLGPLLDAGLLEPGQRLVWRRRNLAQRYLAYVTPEGRLRLDDGRIYDSPSGACDAVAHCKVNGWDAWRTGEGVSLSVLRSRI